MTSTKKKMIPQYTFSVLNSSKQAKETPASLYLHYCFFAGQNDNHLQHHNTDRVLKGKIMNFILI